MKPKTICTKWRSAAECRREGAPATGFREQSEPIKQEFVLLSVLLAILIALMLSLPASAGRPSSSSGTLEAFFNLSTVAGNHTIISAPQEGAETAAGLVGNGKSFDFSFMRIPSEFPYTGGLITIARWGRTICTKWRFRERSEPIMQRMPLRCMIIGGRMPARTSVSELIRGMGILAQRIMAQTIRNKYQKVKEFNGDGI